MAAASYSRKSVPATPFLSRAWLRPPCSRASQTTYLHDPVATGSHWAGHCPGATQLDVLAATGTECLWLDLAGTGKRPRSQSTHSRLVGRAPSWLDTATAPRPFPLGKDRLSRLPLPRGAQRPGLVTPDTNCITLLVDSQVVHHSRQQFSIWQRCAPYRSRRRPKGGPNPAARAWICDRRPVMCRTGTGESRPSKRAIAAWCSPKLRIAAIHASNSQYGSGVRPIAPAGDRREGQIRRLGPGFGNPGRANGQSRPGAHPN